MAGIDQNTLLMLHFDGNVDDASFSKNTVTNSGASFSSAIAKFDQSAHFGGSQYVEFNLTSLFDFSGKNWTVDFWMYQTTANLTGAAFCFGDQFFLFCSGGTWQNFIGPQGYTGNIFGSSPNEWVHIAIVCISNTLTFYKNGQKAYTAAMSGNLPFQSGYAAWIGGRNPREGQYFIGYIDEFRVSNVARWTSDFEPPTKPYSLDVSSPNIFAPSSVIAGKQFVVSWSAVENAVSYTLEQQTNDGEWEQVYTGAGTNYQATAAGSAMSFRVLAIDTEGNKSEYTTSTSIKIFPNISGTLFGGLIGNV